MSQVERCLLLPWCVNTDRLWNLDLSVKELRGRDYNKANSTLENNGESRCSVLMFSASRTLTLLQVGVRCDSQTSWPTEAFRFYCRGPAQTWNISRGAELCRPVFLHSTLLAPGAFLEERSDLVGEEKHDLIPALNLIDFEKMILVW